MRILIGEFRQESNSFNPFISSMEFWEKAGIYKGKEMELALEDKPCAVAGMIKALKESDDEAEIIYGLSMSCQSGGPTDQKVMDYFLENFLASIENNLPLDGIFISFHGALQTTKYDDAEGEILEKIRKISGEKTIIAVSTDLHAYISKKMVKNADIISGYHTYPHIDYFETGYRAAKLGIDCIQEKTEHKMVCVKIPMIVSAASYTTMYGSFKELMDYGKLCVEKNEISDFSIFQMQPWLDISDGGSTVLVIASDYKKAEFFAKEIAQRFFDLRKEFKSNIHSIDEVIDIAEKNDTNKPVILVDSADSCNAGASGDSMAVVARLLERKSTIKAATVVNDADAANMAHKLGVGEKAIFSIGGTRDPNAISIQVEGYVKSLHDGNFVQEGPAGRGIVNSIGPSAVIRIGNIDVLVCHWMSGNGDPQLYRAFGIEPTLYDLIVVKACTSFRASYSKFAGPIYETDTPGAATSNLMKLNFKKIPKSFYPWSDLDGFEINEITYGR